MSYKGFMDRITRQRWQNELYRFYVPYYTSVLTEWVIKVLWTVLHVSVDRMSYKGLWTVLHVSVDKMSYKGFMDRITRQCWQNEL